MTPAQHENTVEALAALVARWLDTRPDPCPGSTADDPDRDGQPLAA